MVGGQDVAQVISCCGPMLHQVKWRAGGILQEIVEHFFFVFPQFLPEDFIAEGRAVVLNLRGVPVVAESCDEFDFAERHADVAVSLGVIIERSAWQRLDYGESAGRVFDPAKEVYGLAQSFIRLSRVAIYQLNLDR